MSYFQSAVTSGQTSADIPVLSVADLRDKYGFSFPQNKESYFTNMILASQKACAGYMGMDTLRQLNDCTEIFDVDYGQRVVVLTGQPLVSVQKVYVGSVEVSNYLLDFRTATIRIEDTSVVADRIKVEYKIGWGVNLPEDLLYCVAMTVQSMSRTANSSLMGKNSQNTDGGSETYEQSVIPLAVRTYLDKYRMMRLA